MTIFDEIQASITRLAEEAGPSVVGIGQRWGIGSGIVLGEGRILTNAHNVRGSHVTATLADGRTTEGNVAGHDINGDLAVIEVDTGQAAALPWATAAPAIGERLEGALQSKVGATAQRYRLLIWPQVALRTGTAAQLAPAPPCHVTVFRPPAGGLVSRKSPTPAGCSRLIEFKTMQTGVEQPVQAVPSVFACEMLTRNA